MKKIILSALVLILLTLDWAALHDIIKGNETDFTAEYSILGLSILFFISLLYYGFKKQHNR